MTHDEPPYLSRPMLFERINEQEAQINRLSCENDNLRDRLAKYEAAGLSIELPSEGSRDEDFDVVAGIRERVRRDEAGGGAVRAEPVVESGAAPVAEPESEPGAEPGAGGDWWNLQFEQFIWPYYSRDSSWYYGPDTGSSV